MIDRDFLRTAAAAEGFALSDEALGRFDLYAGLLVEWNEKVNLTAITAPEEIVVKHFLDSLLLLKSAELPEGAALIDVGTGAGFPSLPCAIIRPDLRVTLLDSLQKRLVFLRELTAALGIDAECVHARAEDAGNNPALREKYDAAAARAVAHLRELSEYCLPFVKVGGTFVALKGNVESELEEALPAIRLMGGEPDGTDKYCLPDGGKRTLVRIRKISPTPPQYPRPAAKMKKQPL